MIELKGEQLLSVANEALQQQSWAKPDMLLTQVEQKGSVLVFYGTGLMNGASELDVQTLSNLDALAQTLSSRYRLGK